ncbi:MAG TPA: hypothetical protein VGJ09_05200 [Bryobacteraceae bacterium]
MPWYAPGTNPCKFADIFKVAGVVVLVRLTDSQFGPAPPPRWDAAETLIGVESLVRLTDGSVTVVPMEPVPEMDVDERIN